MTSVLFAWLFVCVYRMATGGTPHGAAHAPLRHKASLPLARTCHSCRTLRDAAHVNPHALSTLSQAAYGTRTTKAPLAANPSLGAAQVALERRREHASVVEEPGRSRVSRRPPSAASARACSSACSCPLPLQHALVARPTILHEGKRRVPLAVKVVDVEPKWPCVTVCVRALQSKCT
jgi:hypothetical protein